MPKTRLLNIKNLCTWAGIKKKKKKNIGEAEAVDGDSDQENVCLPYTDSKHYANGKQINPDYALPHKTCPRSPSSFETIREPLVPLADVSCIRPLP